jgi:hypothetical protein
MSRHALARPPVAKPALRAAPAASPARRAGADAHADAYADAGFAAAGLRSVPGDIRDEDQARAMATRWLVRELAPLLGLDPATIRISTDAQAASRTDAHGANALSEQDRIFLHPGRFEPHSAHGRYLLAHELAHAAQRGVGSPRGPAHAPAPLARLAAEQEAHEAGTAFAAGHAPRRPRQPLAPLSLAADTGVRALADSVRTSRSREIAQITRFLSGWWVSDGDVFNVLEILDSVAFPVAKAIVQALDAKTHRYWLADNINPPHVLAHRRSVLACYAALPREQLGAIDLKVLRSLSIEGMGLDETRAAQDTLRNIDDGARRELMASDNGAAIKRLMAAPRLSAEGGAGSGRGRGPAGRQPRRNPGPREGRGREIAARPGAQHAERAG